MSNNVERAIITLRLKNAEYDLDMPLDAPAVELLQQLRTLFFEFMPGYKLPEEPSLYYQDGRRVLLDTETLRGAGILEGAVLYLK